jgi:hypothetical protein
MRFHSPLDDVQLDRAIRTHSDLRHHLRTLRQHFPPRTSEERRALAVYRELIQDFARELLKPHGKINVTRLNELLVAIEKTAVNYAALSYE